MLRHHLSRPSTLLRTIAMATLLLPFSTALPAPPQAGAAGRSADSPAVLVELFTSEGCSGCPPADDLLRQINGHTTASGQLIVGISEHVSYWNGLGWRDPFSSESYTDRQNDYGAHFRLDSVYTPQMVVNGREEFVGSDRSALQAALNQEARRPHIELHIASAHVVDQTLHFSYSAGSIPVGSSLRLVAVIVDDSDRSSVLRGENSGRQLVHAAVARAMVPLGTLQETSERSISLPLPPSFLENPGVGHHLLLFAQQAGNLAVLGTDVKPI